MNTHSTISILLSVIFLHACSTYEAREYGEQSNTSTIKPVDTAQDSPTLSTDGLGVKNNDSYQTLGKGTGDLVLLVYDASGHSKRKRSILVDLSVSEPNGAINDLTCNDIFNQRNRFTFSHQELSKFIKDSQDPRLIDWQVFGITNHRQGNLLDKSLKFINHGLISTEISRPKKPLNPKEIHKSRALRADLILQNIENGIHPNDTLISFTGEPSAYNPSLHKLLSSGAKTGNKLGKASTLGYHQLILKEDPKSQVLGFGTKYSVIGKMKLTYDEVSGVAYLQFSPKH